MVGAAALLMVGGLPAGCGGPAGASAEKSPEAAGLNREAAGRVGVEVSVYTVETSDCVAAVLGPAAGIEPATQTPGSALEAWHGSGLRVVRIPASKVAEVVDALEAGGMGGAGGVGGRQVTRQTLRPGAAWVEAVREEGSAEARVVALHDSRFRASRGWLRLLARCWPEPSVAEEGGGVHGTAEMRMRIELVPQAAEAPGGGGGGGVGEGGGDAWARSITPATTTSSAEEQGLVIRRLLATFVMKPGEALAVVYESPDTDWARASTGAMSPEGEGNGPGKSTEPGGGVPSGAGLQADPAPAALGEVRRGGARRTDGGGAAPEPGASGATGRIEGQPSGAVLGPAEVFRVPLLGELLLGTGPDPSSRRRVVLLVPRGAREFRLLGR